MVKDPGILYDAPQKSEELHLPPNILPPSDVSCFVHAAINRFDLCRREYLGWYDSILWGVSGFIKIITQQRQAAYFNNLKFVQRALGIKKREIRAEYNWLKSLEWRVNRGIEEYETKEVIPAEDMALLKEEGIDMGGVNGDIESSLAATRKHYRGLMKRAASNIAEIDGYIAIANLYRHILNGDGK